MAGLASKHSPLGPELSGGAHVRLATAGLNSPFPRAGRLKSLGRPLGGPFFIGETPGLAPGVSLSKSGNIWVD